VLDNALHMAARRTQIDLTAERRKRLDERRRRAAALNSTFGALPNLQVPSRGEWEKRAT
jgi:hypothetical protein